MSQNTWAQAELPLDQDLKSLIEDLAKRFGVETIELVLPPDDGWDEPR